MQLINTYFLNPQLQTIKIFGERKKSNFKTLEQNRTLLQINKPKKTDSKKTKKKLKTKKKTFFFIKPAYLDCNAGFKYLLSVCYFYYFFFGKKMIIICGMKKAIICIQLHKTLKHLIIFRFLICILNDNLSVLLIN